MTTGSSTQALMRTDPWHFLQVSMSILKDRSNRWAQVIARDGMYAGFAGAKTGHRRVALGEAAVIPFLISLLAPLASARWCDQGPVLAIESEHAVKSGQIHSGFGHQCR